MFVGKVRTITRPGTLVLNFMKASCLSIYSMQGKLNGGKREDTVLQTKEKMNQKRYNKILINNLVCSVCTGKYFHVQTSFSVNRSLKCI